MTSGDIPEKSNAHDLWIGLGLDAKGAFPSDRLLVIE